MFFVFFLLFNTLIPRAFPADAAAPPINETVTLSLKDSVNRALMYDHDVLRAASSLEAAHASLSSAQRQFFPKVDLAVQAGTFHDRIPQPGDQVVPLVSRDRNIYVGQVILSQPIFSGFQKFSALRKYGAKEHAAELSLQIAKQRSIEEIITLYYGAQLYERQLIAEKEVQSFRERQLKLVEHRRGEGAATDLHQLQALYAVKKEIPKIEDLEAELARHYLKLYRRLNLPLNGNFKLTDPIPPGNTVADFKMPPLAEAYDFALTHNLSVRKLESDLDALEAKSGESMAVHLPSINLDLNAGTRAYQRQDIATTNSLAYGAQISLRIPLFSGFDSFSNRDMWQARLAAFKEERAKLRETLLNDLNDTYRRLEISTHHIEASKVNLDLTQRAVQLAERSYRVGAATLLDVLNAYSALLEAKKQANQDAYDRILALFHIKALLGLGSKFDS